MSKNTILIIVIIALVLLGISGSKKEGNWIGDSYRTTYSSGEGVMMHGIDACDFAMEDKDDWFSEHDQNVRLDGCHKYSIDVERCVVYWARLEGYNAGYMTENINQYYFTWGSQDSSEPYTTKREKYMHFCSGATRMPSTTGELNQPCYNDADCKSPLTCDFKLYSMQCKYPIDYCVQTSDCPYSNALTYTSVDRDKNLVFSNRNQDSGVYSESSPLDTIYTFDKKSVRDDSGNLVYSEYSKISVEVEEWDGSTWSIRNKDMPADCLNSETITLKDSVWAPSSRYKYGLLSCLKYGGGWYIMSSYGNGKDWDRDYPTGRVFITERIPEVNKVYDSSKSNLVCQSNKCVLPCSDSSWSPATDTVDSGVAFTQTSNCGNTRQATGTKITDNIVSVTLTDVRDAVSRYLSETVSRDELGILISKWAK